MSGCGFEIDWGDPEPLLPASARCSARLRHVYGRPGSFRVVVTTYRILPNDARETTWSTEATVTVGMSAPD